MPTIKISDKAHAALVKASPTINTEGSIKTKGGWMLQVDDETMFMLGAPLGMADYSAAILRVCGEKQR